MRPIFLVSETFEIFNPDNESDYVLESDSNGFNFQDQSFELRELVDYIKDNGFTQPSRSDIKGLQNGIGSCHVWLSTVDANINYSTGEEEFKYLHFGNMSCHNFYRICVLAGIK